MPEHEVILGLRSRCTDQKAGYDRPLWFMRSVSLAHGAQPTYCPQFHTIHPKVIILDKIDAINSQLLECA